MNEKTTETLNSIGIKYGLDQSSLKHNYFEVYEKFFPVDHNFRIAIVGSSELAVKEAIAISESYPSSTVYFILFGPEKNIIEQYQNTKLFNFIRSKDYDELRTIIASLDNIDFLIEHSNNKKSTKLNIFLNVFLTLPPGATYFIEDLHSTFMEKYEDCSGPNILEYICLLTREKASSTFSHGEIKYHLASALGSFNNFGRLGAAQRSQKKYLTKITESTADLYFSTGNKNFLKFTRNFEKEDLYPTNLQFHSNRKEFDSRFKTHIATPAVKIRSYSNVICAPGQVVAINNVVLPETFRMPLKKIGRNRHLNAVGHFFAEDIYKDIHYLSGDYLYLDNEVPGHFGHITAELISKLWAWESLSAQYPEIHIISSSKDGSRSKVLDEILSIFGIPLQRIIYFSSPTLVENLHCPTQKFHIGKYAIKGIEKTWKHIFDSAFVDTDLNGKKIFLSRSKSTDRGCLNQEEVEKIFSECGFEIIFPENYTIREQISICGTATAIAGFAGSATLNAVYSKPGIKKIIISSETFDADNDIVISSLKGDKLYYFWCDSSIKHPTNGWSEKAFHSDYIFDINRDALSLKAAADVETP